LERGDNDVLEWLKIKGIYPTQAEADPPLAQKEDIIIRVPAQEPARPSVITSAMSGLINWWYQK
jgi:hypothetical protein